MDPPVTPPSSAGASERATPFEEARAQAAPPPPVEEGAAEAAGRGAAAGKKSKLRTAAIVGASVLGAIALFALAKRAYGWIRTLVGGGAGLAGVMGRGAAAIPYVDAKLAQKGAADFAAFVKTAEAAPLVGALGQQFVPQLLWLFSGVAPSIYLPAAGIGANGQPRPGIDAAKLALLQPLLEQKGFVVRQDGAEGISIFNVEASQRVANANPDVFPELARTDMRKWLSSPDVVLHAGADHANAHQVHLWYGLLSGFAPEATRIHCARERVMAKVKASVLPFDQKAAVTARLNEIHAIEHLPQPLAADRVARLKEATTELKAFVATVLTAEEQELLQMVSREPQAGPVHFNAYTAADAKWQAGQAQLAKGVLAHPEIKTLLAPAA